MGEALTVLDIGRTLGEDGDWYTTVVVDVTRRPDVADLARVHAVEGTGDLTTYLSMVAGGLVLVVALTRPVECRFAIEFRIPDHLPCLIDAAVAGHLLVATTLPGEHNPAWLALDLDPGLLVSALAAARGAGEGRGGRGGGSGGGGEI